MSIELHNFTWEGVRLVQVETQPHHIAGVLANIRDTLENSDCEWEDIYSASYNCEEDGTTTFYEGVYPEPLDFARGERVWGDGTLVVTIRPPQARGGGGV